MKKVNIKNIVGANLCVRPNGAGQIRRSAPTCQMVMIALLAILVMVSCGGGSSKQQSGNASETKTEQAATSGTTLKELNDNNWQSVIKANFGLDIAIPAGWSFQSVKSLNRVNNLELVLTTGGGTTGKEECRRLFEATKALSPQGNYKNNANWEAETVSAGDVISDFSNLEGMFPDGDVITSWAFTFNSKMIMVNYTARGNWAQYTFTINKTIK